MQQGQGQQGQQGQQGHTRGRHRRPWRAAVLRRAGAPALAIVVASGLTVSALAGAPGASAAAIVNPSPPRPAPAVIEGYTPYLPQVSCDPTVKSGTAALRTMLLTTYGGRDLGVTRACDIGGLSEHKEGRAFDWGLRVSVRSERAIAGAFIRFVTARHGYNARRLGIMYMIWNAKIWGAYRADEGWRKYTGAEAHKDHIHISLSWAGAMKRTSWWTGRTAAVDYGPCVRIEGELAPRYAKPRTTPCPAPTPVMDLTGTPLLKYDSEGPYVRQLQMRLKVKPVSGWFGTLTQSRLETFQDKHGLPVTGTTTKDTWTVLRGGSVPTTTPTPNEPAPKVASRFRTRLTVTVRRGQTLSWLARHWRSEVASIKAANHLSGDTIRTGQRLSIPVRSSLTRYVHRTLRLGMHGAPVRALQGALHMPRRYRTGYFGSITRRYVNAFRHRVGMRMIGVAGPQVWVRLGA